MELQVYRKFKDLDGKEYFVLHLKGSESNGLLVTFNQDGTHEIEVMRQCIINTLSRFMVVHTIKYRIDAFDPRGYQQPKSNGPHSIIDKETKKEIEIFEIESDDKTEIPKIELHWKTVEGILKVQQGAFFIVKCDCQCNICKKDYKDTSVYVTLQRRPLLNDKNENYLRPSESACICEECWNKF